METKLPPLINSKGTYGNWPILSRLQKTHRRHPYDEIPNELCISFDSDTDVDNLTRTRKFYHDVIYDEDTDRYLLMKEREYFLNVENATRTLTFVLPYMCMKYSASSLVDVTLESGGEKVVNTLMIVLYLLGEDGLELCSRDFEQKFVRDNKLRRQKQTNGMDSVELRMENDADGSLNNLFMNTPISETQFGTSFTLMGQGIPNATVDVEYITSGDNIEEPLFLLYHVNILNPCLDLHLGLKNLAMVNSYKEKQDAKSKRRAITTTTEILETNSRLVGMIDDRDEVRKEHTFLEKFPPQDLCHVRDFYSQLSFACGFNMDNYIDDRNVHDLMVSEPLFGVDRDEISAFNMYAFLDRQRMFGDDENGYDIFKVCANKEIIKLVEMMNDFDGVQEDINEEYIFKNKDKINEAVCNLLGGGEYVSCELKDFTYIGDDLMFEREDEDDDVIDMTFYRYDDPLKVIRYETCNITPVVFVNSVFPHRINDVVSSTKIEYWTPPNPTIKFPLMTPPSANTLRAVYLEIEKKGFKDNKNVLTESISEKIRKLYFGVDVDVNVCKITDDIRRKESYPRETRDKAFTMGDVSRKGEFNKYPQCEESIFLWLYTSNINKQNKYSCFTDLSAIPGFKKYNNMAPSSNFLANFTMNFLESGVLFLSNSHREALLCMLLVPFIYRGDTTDTLTPSVYIGGKKGTGKSYIFKLLRSFIHGSWLNIGSTTEMANTTNGMKKDKAILISDDLNPNDAIFGNKKDDKTSGIEKSLITQGYHDRETYAQGIRNSGSKIARSWMRSLRVRAGNFYKLDGAFEDRYHKIIYDDKMKFRTGRDIQSQNFNAEGRADFMEDKLKELMSGVQIFACFIGNMIREGSIKYDSSNERALYTVMKRYQDILRKVYDLDFTAETRLNIKVKPIAYGLMIFRLYVCTCYGLIPGLDPKEPFNSKKLREIFEPLLVITEEDVIQALSFFVDKLNTFSQKDLIKNIIEHYNYPGLYKDGNISMSSDQLRLFNAKEYRDGNGTLLYDYDFIDLTAGDNPYILPGSNLKSMLSQKAKNIGINVTDYSRSFYALSGKEKTYVPIIEQAPVFGLDLMENDSVTKKDHIITQYTEHNANSNTFMDKKQKIYIQRSVLDEAVNDSSINLFDKIKNFKNADFTNALHLLAYEGSRERDILLPGLPYRNPDDNSTEKYSCLFDYAQMKKPTEEELEIKVNVNEGIEVKRNNGSIYITTDYADGSHLYDYDSYNILQNYREICKEFNPRITDEEMMVKMEEFRQAEHFPTAMDKKFIEMGEGVDYLRTELRKLIGEERANDILI